MPSSSPAFRRRAALAAAAASLSSLAGCQTLDRLSGSPSRFRRHTRDAPVDGDRGPWPTTRGGFGRRSFADRDLDVTATGRVDRLAPASRSQFPEQPAVGSHGVLALVSALPSDVVGDGEGAFTGTLGVTTGGVRTLARRGVGSTVAAVGDAAILPGESGVVAVDARNGAECWRFETGTFPTLVGDVCCLEAGDHLYGLDVRTGTVRWAVENVADDDSYGYTVDAFAASDDRLFATRKHEYDAPSLVALDARDGSVEWRGDVDRSGWPPVVGPDRVYVLSASGTLTAFSLDGTREWARALDLAAPPAVGDDRLVATTASAPRSLVALDPATGAELWRTPVAADACAVPAVTPRRAYVTESGARTPVSIAAIDVASGERRWTRSIPSTADDAGSLTASAPALADDGLVVAVVGNDAFASGRGTYLVA
ncbi:PQQ-binding-like beta-propeller repeat protein [Halorubellus litoreus]|uniref:PQQ-binding-like beta-propeller repeat protein n=1 Tax=Halorubellus litoreus TaxID=755308 RepID=A0ABD5VMW4_9EURY